MSSNISFAQNLQSDTGQQSIMSRIENEIRVLEVLKKFLTVQIRVEKQYSSSLANATTAAMKTLSGVISPDQTEGGQPLQRETTGLSQVQFSDESIVTRACVHVLQEVQTTANTLKENSDYLNVNTLKLLNELIAEKKILLKMTQEEYQKIKGRLDQFTEIVNKHKAEYLKNFQTYESTRTKYEDHCAKGAKVNIKRSEDCRDKFFRTKRRLNLYHAEYLIALHEAGDYDRDFRTILLPGLLQIEQTWCEKQMGKWSEVLDQILNNSPSLTASLHFKLRDFEFSKEYLELISKNKSPPLQPSNFKFEPAQISSQPVTQPTIIVDSSTIDFLRGRLAEVEKRLKLIETQLVEKNAQFVKQKGTMLGDLKSLEISETRSEIDRLKSLKILIETYFKALDTSGPVNQLDETISLISEQSMKRGATNRFATFLRAAAAKTKKAVSFDEEPVAQQAYNTFTLPSSVSKASSTQQLNGNSNADKNMASLLGQGWFHGVLPREDVVRLLKVEGDYLVRETMKNDERQLVLSVQWNGPKHFMIQTTPDGQFRFEGPISPTVKELLSQYVRLKIPVTSRSGAVIKKAVKREVWELNNDDVQLIEKIGKGNFGDVYKASINGTLVAVKTCKINLPEEQKRKFLQEGRILKQYDHANIVRFVGICVQKQPIMIVMELVTGGSLLTYLKSRGRSLTTKELAIICLHAASGMKYLEEKSCIHRDLAARNCLIDQNVFVKISDFGMSREEHEYTVSDGMKQIPIKWTAPEALNYGKYTSLSDVWSYGILMWEIFSQGSTPYMGMTNAKAREMIEAGYRMPAPSGMPDVIYQLMARCWQYEAEQRPRFSEIYSELEVMSRSDLI